MNDSTQPRSIQRAIELGRRIRDLEQEKLFLQKSIEDVELSIKVLLDEKEKLERDG